MDSETLAGLIEKYIEGTLTPREEHILMEWYEKPENAPPYTDAIAGQRKADLADEIWNDIKTITGKPEATPSQRKVKAVYTGVGVAAAILLAVLALPTYRYLAPGKQTYHTAFGEVRSVTLPDNSQATLNGNSKIVFKEGKNREVWLEGEAFFRVAHKKNDQRFLVHLADTLTVEVIGTEFNVQQRSSGTEIALISGKIRLIAGEKRIAMRPGDIIQFGKYAKDGFELSANTDIGGHMAWQRRRLQLERTSLAEMLDHLDETFGIKTVVLQTELLQRQASGSIPVVADSEQFLNHIVALYGLVIAETTDDRQFVLTAH